MAKKLVKYTDGKLSVAQIAAKLPVPYQTVVVVVSQLVRLGLIGLRPIVNLWDMYMVTSKLRLLLADEKLRAECIKQATLPNQGAGLTEPVSLDSILNFLTQLQHGVTIGELKLRNKSITESADVK